VDPLLLVYAQSTLNMLQRLAWVWRLAIELDTRQIEGILHPHDVAFELTPAIGVCWEGIFIGEVPVERGQDSQQLIIS
jgi:hypothetical protein